MNVVSLVAARWLREQGKPIITITDGVEKLDVSATDVETFCVEQFGEVPTAAEVRAILRALEIRAR